MALKRIGRLARVSCWWRYRRLLSPYLDSALDPRAHAQVGSHIEKCAGCRVECEEMRFASRLVLRLSVPVAEPPRLPALLAERLTTPAAKPARSSRRRRLILAPAAAMLLLAVGGTAVWYYTHPSNAPWEVVRLEGTPKVGAELIGGTGRLAEGEWLETDGSSRARLSVGRIGHVEIGPHSRVSLVETRLTEHRLALARGRLNAWIWAPPRLFLVDTPSAQAIDLGCAYSLEVDEAGGGLLHVTAGWVALARDGRESKVPAGALCATRPGTGPGTPFFADAPVGLRQALEQFDFADGGVTALSAVLAEARPRDTLTLWHLLARVTADERGRVYDRLAAFAPPPEGVTREGMLRLDQPMLMLWREQLEPIWLPESMPRLRKVWRRLWG